MRYWQNYLFVQKDSKASYQILALGELWLFEPGSIVTQSGTVYISLEDTESLLSEPLDNGTLWARCDKMYREKISRHSSNCAFSDSQRRKMSSMIRVGRKRLEEITSSR